VYLATLSPQNPALSTYFVATLDMVGGGGASQKPTSQKQQKKETKETMRLPTTTTMPILTR